MKKYIYIFLMSYCSYMNSSETEIASDILNEPITTETTLPVPLNNGIYIFPSIDRILPEGIAYRHHLNDSRFYEISFSSKKLAIIELYKIIDNGHTLEPIKIGENGSIYNNMLNVSYGFIYNTKYVHPYFSIGAGAFLPSLSQTSVSLIEALPAISSSLGFEFGYGFLDFTMSYLPKKWTYEVFNSDHILNDLGVKNDDLSRDFVNDLRLGIGFRF